MKNQCSNLENQEISILTININICEEVNNNLAIKALISCLISICILALNEPVKEAMAAPAALGIAQSNSATRFDWLIDLSAFLAVLYAVVSTIESLAKKWECRELQNKLVQLLSREETKDTPSSSWLDRAGRFSDDPFFDEFVEEMAKNRRELDAEVNAWLDAEENKQQGSDDISN